MNQRNLLESDPIWDRLVDGQLTPVEYRELLRQLDEQPALWRRCALAFLEAQAWQRELGELVARPVAAAKPVPTSREWTAGNHVADQPRTGGRMLLTLAAAVVAAFFLGVWSGPQWSAPARQPPVVHHEPSPTETSMPSDTPPHITRTAATPENLTLMVADELGQRRRDVEVPLVNLNAGGEPWLNEQASAIPADVLQTFRRLGHQVKQEREFVTVALPDGRQAVVPVDHLEITPLSLDTFQ